MKICQNDVHTRILNAYHRFRFFGKKCAIVNMVELSEYIFMYFMGTPAEMKSTLDELAESDRK